MPNMGQQNKHIKLSVLMHVANKARQVDIWSIILFYSFGTITAGLKPDNRPELLEKV